MPVEVSEEEWFDMSDEDRAEYNVQLLIEIVTRLGPNAPDGELQREFNRLRRPDPVIQTYEPFEEDEI